MKKNKPMKNKFIGTGVAIVTPFRRYGSIDFGSLTKLVEHLLLNGVDYLVVLGTTGEAATLSLTEKNAVVNHVVSIVEGKIPIVVGVGGNCTNGVVQEFKKLDLDNVDGILSVTPYYNKPQPKGIYQHYKTVASATDLPVILYNVPGRTGVNIPAEIVLKLANDIYNIVAVKEASGNMSQIMKIINDKPDGFGVISGDDQLTLPLIASGASGVISVTANAFPAEYSKMVNYSLNNDFIKAREIQYSLLNIMDTLFEDGNPAGVKAALEHLGILENNLRLPLVKVNKTVNNSLKSLISEFRKKK